MSKDNTEQFEEVVDLSDFSKRFATLALEKNFCVENNLPELTERYSAHPEFFVYLVEIFQNRKTSFSSVSEFYSAFAFGPKDPETLRKNVEWAQATRGVNDEKHFDLIWLIYRSERSTISYGAAEEMIDRMNAVMDRIFDLCPDMPHFSAMNFRRAEVVISRSSEPKRDIGLITSTLDGVSHATSADELEAYYEEGHQYICHPEYWESRKSANPDFEYAHLPSGTEDAQARIRREEKERKQAGLRKEIDIRAMICKSELYPSLEVQERLVPQITKIEDDDLRVQMVKLLPIFLDKKLSIEYYERLVAACAGSTTHTGKPNTDPTLRILFCISEYDEDVLTTALFVLEDILGRDDVDMEHYAGIFEKGDLSEIEREIYRAKLASHASKFPEKPIDQVEREFQEKKNIDSEVVPKEVLDRALGRYDQILSIGQELIALPDMVVFRRAEEFGNNGIEGEGSKVRFFALARELFKREYGVYPYNTQLIAILILIDEGILSKGKERKYRGVYEQIKTGEGKSLILSLVATYFGVQGREVDMITSNPYLAKRDAMTFEKYYGYFGLKADAFEHKEGEEQVMKRNPRIIYTTNHDMIFAHLACRLKGQPFFQGRRFDTCLVDEADNLCIDMGQDSCRIAQPADSMFDQTVLAKFLEFVDVHEDHILENLPTAIAEFKKFAELEEGIHAVYIGLYLRSALRSKKVQEGEDFVIREGKIVIVDVKNTGRLKERAQWDHGLHEFITLRHNLDLPQSMGVAAEMNHPTFIRKYRNMYCISGTMGDSVDRSEIREVYNMIGLDVPSHYPSRRDDRELVLHKTEDEFKSNVLAKVGSLQGAGQPVLLLTQSVKESNVFCKLLRDIGFQVQLLNDVSNQDVFGNPAGEEVIIDRAGGTGMITVATSVAGRGADIKPDDDSVVAGGVYSLLTFVPYNKRVEFQNRGRAGRQGQPGVSEIIACMETDLFIKDLPDQIQEVIVDLLNRFGSESPEVRIAIDFIRRCNGLVASVHRRFNDDKDVVIQGALDNYFMKMGSASATLNEANTIIATNPDLASYLFSLYVGESWASEFDYFQTIVRHEENEPVISLDDFRERNKNEGPFESPYLSHLDTCFERSTAGYPRDQLSYGPFSDVAGFLYQDYLSRLLTIEKRMREFDGHRASKLAEGLRAKVDALVNKFHDEFKGAEIIDIRTFLEEKEGE